MRFAINTSGNIAKVIEDNDERKLENALSRVKATEAELERKDAQKLHYQQTPKPVQVAAVSVCTLTENVAKDGYELRFPGPIDENWSKLFHDFRDPEHANDSRYRWFFARFNGYGRSKQYDPRWYAKRSKATLLFARAAVKVLNGVDTTIISNGENNP